jgi:hypothetical protein
LPNPTAAGPYGRRGLSRVGAAISGLNFWLYGRTADQLNSFHIRLEQTQKFLLANIISTKLTGEAHYSALTDLIKSMAI